MKKLGTITIGQSPRIDVIPEMKKYLGNVEVIEEGALNTVTKEDIEKMTPDEDDYVLVSRLRDGSSVRFGERHILPLLQEAIYRLEEQGVDLILFICTGVFPDIFTSKVPLLYPDKIIGGLIPSLVGKERLGIITPDEKQIEQGYEKWGDIVENVTIVNGSPYKEKEEIIKASRNIKDKADIILLDCIGYDETMKEIVKEETGKLVIVSKTMIARVLGELLN